jgi:carboxymethylenebutenolidase
VDEARKAISGLKQEGIAADLNAAADYAKRLPAANGKLTVAGFCWGGGQAFAYAGVRPDLSATFVFYGEGPDDSAQTAKITAPVFGFYGAKDARVTSTVPVTQEAMTEAGKKYAPEIYDDAGHGFMRAGEEPNATEGNRQAREKAWGKWKSEMLKL